MGNLKMIKIAGVVIDNGYASKRYYFITDLETLVEGDKVVADTVNGLVIGTFKGYVTEGTKPTKWIIGKIDLDKHEERKAKEKHLKDLKKKMDARRKKVEELEIYEILAGKDSDMAAMLAEYKAIKGAAE